MALPALLTTLLLVPLFLVPMRLGMSVWLPTLTPGSIEGTIPLGTVTEGDMSNVAADC